MMKLLITGANRGIGLEFCRQYTAAGWRVLACCREPGKAVALNELAHGHANLLKLYTLDVANHAQIEHLASQLRDESIDLLINNAGVYPASDHFGFGNTDYAQWMAAFNINATAPLKMVEAFISQIERGKLKRIVTITSQMGSIADNTSGGNYLYRSSKAAANMVVKSLAVDLKARGITSVALNPGWVKTDMGGSNAIIPVEESVRAMRKLIEGLTLGDTGKFLGHSGRVIPW
jgi:NAD(P)-dependent dehydrogenase (short-subunit alcohol dehydrogenase family)